MSFADCCGSVVRGLGCAPVAVTDCTLVSSVLDMDAGDATGSTACEFNVKFPKAAALR